MRTMEVADLQTHIHELLAEMSESREAVVLTENGQALAELKSLPPKRPPLRPGENPLDWYLIPRASTVGDITEPLYSDQELEEFFEASARQLEGS